MKEAFICDAVRTPVGRYGGALSSVRPDDLAAMTIEAIVKRNPSLEPSTVDDVVFGCANQAGEDNRNVARMALLLAGLPETVPGVTVNRLCASGLDAVGWASRAVKCGEADVVVAGGVESMSRAPFVVGKSDSAFSRSVELFDTTIGWRFVNPRMKKRFGTDSMIETAENVAAEWKVSREEQDLYALQSQQKALGAQKSGLFDDETMPVVIPQRKGEFSTVRVDEHPRETSLERLAALTPLVGDGGTVTAGNSSGVNDGAAALLVASAEACARYGLTPRARVVGMASTGTTPRTMGLGPVRATTRLLGLLGSTLDDFDVIELNEAFAVQALACLRDLSVSRDDPRLNPRGGAIALGHPLGMSGARLVTTAFHQLLRRGGGRALCTMCVGVGQGVALAIETVS